MDEELADDLMIALDAAQFDGDGAIELKHVLAQLAEAGIGVVRL